MTTEIPKKEWKEFFDNLSRNLAGWETAVEVVSNALGAQMLAEGLPFGGLTFEENGAARIELGLGSDVSTHQSHSILEPVAVAFENVGPGPSGVLDIEDLSGAKTLVRFIRPFPVLAEYHKAGLIAAK